MSEKLMREIDGLKIAFVGSDSYFESLTTPSMVSTARRTGADVTMLLAPGKTEDDLSDDDLRAIIGLSKGESQ
ncbi:hypothetical protein [Novilysobacter erysipheiresistens]|uniref:NYN domain-containing protein n=1 Tax=Novilysobacter erysipheiresistens TaxID=1749332 RepID=A0ABU7YUT3_9GAMM